MTSTTDVTTEAFGMIYLNCMCCAEQLRSLALTCKHGTEWHTGARMFVLCTRLVLHCTEHCAELLVGAHDTVLYSADHCAALLVTMHNTSRLWAAAQHFLSLGQSDAALLGTGLGHPFF